MDTIRPTPPPEDSRRPRWLVAELDVDGAIDAHAALCLRNAIEDAGAVDGPALLVDLRDLGAIDAAGVRLLAAASASCRVRGMTLGLLISADARHDAIAGAFDAAGLDYARRVPQAGAQSEPPPAARRVARPSPTAPISAVSAAVRSATPRCGAMTAATSAVASG
jgi:anti-anti-sigma factor